MSLLQASKVALRTVRKHTLGLTDVQQKILLATENGSLNGAPFVSLAQRYELAQLSWDNIAFEEIIQVMKQRLTEKKKWRKVIKALMVLHYCLQEGSSRFGSWCEVNMDILEKLETYPFTPDAADGRDRAIDIRREVRKVLSLLSDPQYVEIRGHAEGTHLARKRTLQLHHEQQAQAQAKAKAEAPTIKSSLRRRGALFGFRKSEGSDTTVSSYITVSTVSTVAPAVTIKQKVRSAISDTTDLGAAMEDIKEIARSTNSPSDFLEILEAILESLISSEQDRHWSQVFQAVLLLRHCLDHVSRDLMAHFEGNHSAMTLLRDFENLGNANFLDRLPRANPPRATPDVSVIPEKSVVAETDDTLAEVVDAPTVERPTEKTFEGPEPRPPPRYTLLTNIWELDEKGRLIAEVEQAPRFRRLPAPPIDWSRLRNPISRTFWPELTDEKRNLADTWQSSQQRSTHSLRPLPLPPSLDASPTDEQPPEYVSEGDPALCLAMAPPPEYNLVAAQRQEQTENTAAEYAHTEVPVEEQVEVPGPSSPGKLREARDSPGLRPTQPAPAARVDFGEPAGGIPIQFDLQLETTNSQRLPKEASSELCHPSSTPPADSGSSSPPPSQTTASCTVSPVSADFEPVVPAISVSSADSCLQVAPPVSKLSPSPTIRRCLTGMVERGEEAASTKGGFSDVWKGWLKVGRGSNETKEQVAIKVLRAVKMRRKTRCPTEVMQKRMNREMDIWGRLEHPNIVPLRGYALEEDGTPQLISPWYTFGDILAYLETHPFADRRNLVRQVASGLTYLHTQDPPVIHGDLKSGNVLINAAGDAGLCDFGLSKLLQDYPSEYTTSSLGVGTIRWCAPELLVSDEPQKTLASDVWAFAALALEILTGRLPFYKFSNNAKVICDISQGLIPAREDYPELAAGCRFWEVLESCWKQDPSERPSMKELWPLIFDDEMFSLNILP